METKEDKLTEKLKESGQKVEKAVKARREREVKGSHLLDPMKAAAEKRGLVLAEKSGFFKITGKGKGRAIYLARNGGRVDLSGFSVEAEAIAQISKEDAQAKHLGKVRGQIDFTKPDEVVLKAYDTALTELLNAPVEEPKSAAADTTTAA